MSRWTTNDLAVVVQGPCGPTTATCIASVRAHLPGAHLVLSSWAGSDVRPYDVDDVVLSEDPGSFSSRITEALLGPPVNTNRMIVSTTAGLARVDRPWTLKLRTDAVVRHAGAVGLLDELTPTTGEWALFDRLVAVSSVYTRHPAKTPSGSFHPADTVQLGRTDDLRRLWQVPLMPPEEVDWFDTEDRPHWAITAVRYYPEQYVFLAALRTRFRVEVVDRTAMSPEVFEASNRALAQNFYVAEPWQLGATVPKLDQHLRWSEDPTCVMTHPLWHDLHVEATNVQRAHPWGVLDEVS